MKWFSACSVPSHHLNQCRFIVNSIFDNNLLLFISNYTHFLSRIYTWKCQTIFFNMTTILYRSQRVNMNKSVTCYSVYFYEYGTHYGRRDWWCRGGWPKCLPYIYDDDNKVENPSKISPQLKSRKISFVHNISCSRRIILKFCTEHGSHTAVLCAKFQKDIATIKDVMRKRDFTIFQS